MREVGASLPVRLESAKFRETLLQGGRYCFINCPQKRAVDIARDLDRGVAETMLDHLDVRARLEEESSSDSAIAVS